MFRARILLLVVTLDCASAWTVACAADPGDAPKSGDGPAPGGNDASPAPVSDGDDSPDEQDAGRPADDAWVGAGVDSATLDSPGEDGAPDMAAPDGPAPDAPACTLCLLVVEYMTPAAGPTKEIQPYVEITNDSASDEDLTALTLRYWYTADGSPAQAFACDYALLGCGVVQAKFVTMAAPVATADHYLELSFTGGTLAAGASTGPIQARFHDASQVVTFTQTNDYSFAAAATAYARWGRITLYRGGALLFGVEP